uniref:DUF4216 domain-containing protein n=1 Tax=Chenopodium quinoa TaxID=63459 RepID=A0A803N4S0_CHEQI
MKSIVTFDGYVINGFRLHTKKQQRHRKTQNSGVIVKGDAESGGKDFYGNLEEVIVLEYDALENRTSPKVVLFKCKWFDVFSEGRGIKKDKFGSILVNVSRTLQTNEPFALASQIEQVFYVSSHDERHWKFVIKANPRNFFDFPNDEDTEQDVSLWNIVEERATNLEEFAALSDEEINMVRDDFEPELVDAEQQQQNVQYQQQTNEEQQHDAEATNSEQTRETRLTYREKRRLEQAEHRLKFPDRKRRGPTRGKKYVTRMWNPNSEEKIKINFMDELRCVKDVEEHGEDTLSVKAAYMEAFKPKFGYVKGLDPGARPPKKRRVEGETNEVRVDISAEIQQLKEDAATREGVLVSQIETPKESNEELRTSNEEVIESNDELKAVVSRINIEAQKREKKLRDDMMKMFEQLRYDTFSSSK